MTQDHPSEDRPFPCRTADTPMARHGGSFQAARRLAPLAALLGVMLPGLLPGASCAAEFDFRQSEPEIGSILRRVVGTANIPLDRTYSELTEAEKTCVRAEFANLPANDIPPFPARPMKPLVRSLSSVRWKFSGRGVVNLRLAIDEKGSIQAVRVDESSDDQLLGAVLKAVQATEFTPATCGGKPCAMEFPLSIALEGAAVAVPEPRGRR